MNDSYRTRGTVFAFLIGPPRILDRQDGMRIHSAVCEALGVDDIAFRFQPGRPDPNRTMGYSIQMERQSGREKVTFEISATDPNAPVRILFVYDWPASNQLFLEDFDAASKAMFDALGNDWQRVGAEARIRGQVQASGGTGLNHLSEHLAPLTRRVDARHDRLSFLGFKYETAAAGLVETDHLANPKREVSVEVLREDPRCLYLEVVSHWPQLAIARDGTLEVAPGSVRAFRSTPSSYLTDALDYLNGTVLPLVFRPGPAEK